MSKYKVTIGNEFQIDAVDVPSKGTIDAVSLAAHQLAETKTRRMLAYAIVGATAGALAIAAYIDASGHSGTWQATVGVWTAAGFPLGCVLGHYFAKK